MPIVFGAECEPRGTQSRMQAVEALEAEIGRPLHITRRYINWSDPLISGWMDWSASRGAAALVAWHAFEKSGTTPDKRWADIAAGSYDDWVRTQAASLRDFLNSTGATVYLSFHHEPEDDIDSIGAQGRCGTGPAEFVAAYDHIRNVFGQVLRSATNGRVRFLVTLMAGTYAGGHGGYRAWLPKRYDLLAVDGYNRGPSAAQKSPRSFATIFTPARQAAIAVGKKLVIQEHGTIESPADPAAKAHWFAEELATLRKWPEIAACLYSHVEGASGGVSLDYWADSSAASLKAFAALANDALLGG